MLDDLMGQSNAMQEKMQAELEAIQIEHSIEGISMKGNGAGTITDISINESLLHSDNKEMLEDLLLTCIQEITQKANIQSQEISQKMLGDLFSGGGLGNIFG